MDDHYSSCKRSSKKETQGDKARHAAVCTYSRNLAKCPEQRNLQIAKSVPKRKIKECNNSSNEQQIIKSKSFENLLCLKTCLDKFTNLNHLKLDNCKIESLISTELPNSIETLQNLTLINCDKNIIKAFSYQAALKFLKLQNDSWSWQDFSHEDFNQICKSSMNLKHLVLKGAGTGSFFDSNEFPLRLEKLETTMITFHWYVENKMPRIDFLNSQKETLKELTIDQLPYDFDGGEVLKFIFEEMNLSKFKYGNLELIKDRQKQHIKEFEATEIQITSAFEMIKQFPSIEKLTLKLSKTDVCSDAIEKAIDSSTAAIQNLKELFIVDRSGKQKLLRIFEKLIKQSINLKRLEIDTKDKFVNKIVKKMPSNIKFQRIPSQCQIQGRYEAAVLRAANDQPANQGDGQQNWMGGGADGDEEMRDDSDDEDEDEDDDDNDEGENVDLLPDIVINHGEVKEKEGDFTLNSELLERLNVNNSNKLHLIVFGYPYNQLVSENISEIKQFFRLRGFRIPGSRFRIEAGKILIQGHNVDTSNLIKIEIELLAFCILNKTYQLPLYTLPHTQQISVSCTIREFRSFHQFRAKISFINNLSASLWRENENRRLEDGNFFVSFNIDPISYLIIRENGNALKYQITSNNILIIPITVDPNPFMTDMNRFQILDANS